MFSFSELIVSDLNINYLFGLTVKRWWRNINFIFRRHHHLDEQVLNIKLSVEVLTYCIMKEVLFAIIWMAYNGSSP